MYEEIQIINHWLLSKDFSFLYKKGLDKSYFILLKDVVQWIEDFYKEHNMMPSVETVAEQFEQFEKVTELENVDYLINTLKENKLYAEYKPLLLQHAEKLDSGNIIESLCKLQSDINNLLKKYTGKIKYYDWTKNALDRFEKYMEKHGKGGLGGITSGIKSLDKVTGGWKNDDLITILARTNEGKSYLGIYFAFKAWQSFKAAGITNPVVFISTEMSEDEVAYRLDSLKAHFSNRELNEGRLEDPQLYKEYLEELSKSNTGFLILSEQANGGRPFRPSDIRMIIEKEKPGFVVIDQLYDIVDDGGERDIRKRIVNVVYDIRDINLYTQTPIVIIAQANRDAAKESKKDQTLTPELHHVQESDAIIQKSTRVLSLKLISNNIMKITLRKNRHGEKMKDFYMRVDLDKGIWEESTPEEMVF